MCLPTDESHALAAHSWGWSTPSLFVSRRSNRAEASCACMLNRHAPATTSSRESTPSLFESSDLNCSSWRMEMKSDSAEA